MGVIKTRLTLANPRDGGLAPLQAEALVDTGSVNLCIPEHIRLQLRLEALEQREVTTADGKKHLCDYVGPLKVSFANRSCFTGALVLGDSVFLGAIPIEDLDLVIRPSRQEVVVNPESPNIPSSIVKGLRVEESEGRRVQESVAGGGAFLRTRWPMSP